MNRSIGVRANIEESTGRSSCIISHGEIESDINGTGICFGWRACLVLLGDGSVAEHGDVGRGGTRDCLRSRGLGHNEVFAESPSAGTDI